MGRSPHDRESQKTCQYSFYSTFREVNNMKQLTANEEKRPTVMLHTPWNDSWITPSVKSSVAQLITDAGENIFTRKTPLTGPNRLAWRRPTDWSGKSTLLRAIAGLEIIKSRRILLVGKDLIRLQPEELAPTVSFVTTEKVRIPNLKCRDVVALGRAPTRTGWTTATTRPRNHW